MTITAAPSVSFEARVQGFATGLIGTARVRILDNIGNTVYGPSTVGIAEDPAGSGSYEVTLTAPAVGGQYSVFWDTGVVSPDTTASEDLVVTSSSLSGSVAFATNADLAARLGITLTTAEQTRADLLLDQASGLIRQSTKQNISKVTGDTWVTRGVWGNRLLAPERPIIQVSSVTAQFLNGTTYTLDPITYFVDRDELVRYDWPLSFTVGNGWLGPGWKITVTYDHGYDLAASPVPRQLALCKTVALEVVARCWVNPEAATMEMIGGVQTMYPAVGMMLTDEEEEDLADQFRLTSQTVRLR